MARQTRFVFLLSIPLVVIVGVGGAIGTPRAAEQQQSKHLPVFEDVLRLVLMAYVEDVNIDRVMDGAMRGLTEGLDSSSAFLQPDEVRALETGGQAPAGDLGLTVMRQFYLRVLGVRDGSPAARAGIQTGDYIRQIDATPTRDMSAFTGMRLLRGTPNSKVSLTVIRGNALDPHVFDLVREVPSGDAVKTSMVDGVARVRIVSFGPNTATALASAFAQLEKSKTPAAVIDLRGVADGSPEDGVKAAKLFVKTGTIAVRQVRRGEPIRTTAAEGDGAVTMPIVLLTSLGTSNAAEVFAAALSGNGRAELVGEPTAGMAAIQRLVKLPRGYGLWLTQERYMTVDGANPLHERGLQPEVVASNPPVGFDELPPTTDAALTKAVERAKSKR